MPCCFGGAGGRSKPEEKELDGGLPAVKEEPEADRVDEAEERRRREEAEKEEERQRAAEEEKRKEEEKKREEEAAERKRQEEAAARNRALEEQSARRTREARKRAGSETALVRKELRSMAPKEQQRFCFALRKVMAGRGDAPGTSDYCRLAGLRGWPSFLGQHGEETFPGWHRGLLLELERLLVQADMDLGGDGDVALPYWDWQQLEVNGEVMPTCMRDAFAAMPHGLVDVGKAGDLGKYGYTGLASDQEIRSYMVKADVEGKAKSCLAEACHWMHASKACRRRGWSLEALHDQVAMGCGFPLSDPAYAAYHPCCFLVLCNVDRLYESYLQAEGGEECRRAFQQRQRALRENRGEPNRFERALEPLRHPVKKRALLPAETMSAVEMGYAYEELAHVPGGVPRLVSPEGNEGDNARVVGFVDQAETIGEETPEPIYAAFRGVTKAMLGDRSYSLHVFAMHRDAAATWTPPQPGATSSGWLRATHMGWEEVVGYCGCGTAMCAGSSHSGQSRQVFDVLLDVTGALRRLGLRMCDVELRVLCLDHLGKLVTLEETPLPPPALVGPLFEFKEELSEGSRGSDVSTLQRRLAQLGHDPGPLDGVYGRKVQEAVKSFQQFSRLEADGVAGRATKAKLAAPRKGLLPDLGVAPGTKRFVDGETVHYLVLALPGHLENQRSQTLEDVAHALAQWAKAANLTFAPAEEGPPALTICFEDLAEQGASHHGGLCRQWGQLSESAKDGITLDAGEYWLLRNQSAPLLRPKAVRLYPVLLFAIGSCLGLPHSSDPDSAMWPYYTHEAPDPLLGEQDKLLARSMVKNTRPCGCDAKEKAPACSLQ